MDDVPAADDVGDTVSDTAKDVGKGVTSAAKDVGDWFGF